MVKHAAGGYSIKVLQTSLGSHSDNAAHRNERVLTGALFLWFVAYIAQVLKVSDIEGRLVTAGATTSEGSLYNQLLIFAFGAIGVVAIALSKQPTLNRSHLSIWMSIGLYFTWAVCTIFWSDDVSLSLRRLCSFILVLIGCYGIGAFHYGHIKQGTSVLGRHVLFSSIVSMLLLILFRLTDYSLKELVDPEWSLKATTHVATFGYHFGFAILAASILIERTIYRRSLIFLLFLFLVLIKGRIMIAATLCAFTLVGVLTSLRRRTRLAWSALLIFCSSILADLATGGGAMRTLLALTSSNIARWMPYLTIGRGEENLTELSGREPLWNELTRLIADSPWIGHGFGAFWTPARLDRINTISGWPAVNAHNGFIDEILATGIIGLAFFSAILAQSFTVVARRSGRGSDDCNLVLAWLLLFVCFNAMDSILQFFAQLPMLICVTAIFAVTTPTKGTVNP